MRRRFLSSDQGGTALVELVLCLPFMMSLLVSVVDLTRVISQYFYLSQAVSAGAEKAMTAPALATGVDYVAFQTGTCVGTSNRSSKYFSNRIEDLIDLQTNALRDICITARRDGPLSPALNRETVFVSATARYMGYFPLFDGIQISAQVRVPYLLDS